MRLKLHNKHLANKTDFVLPKIILHIAKRTFLVLMAYTCTVVCAFAQRLNGLVRDKESGEAIAFANIVFIGAGGELLGGTASDIEGRFNWQLKGGEQAFRISAIGYKTETVIIHSPEGGFYEILVNKIVRELREVVVYASENPAHAIIRKAVANKPLHDPEKITEYAYKIYNKFIITVSGTYAAAKAIAESDLNLQHGDSLPSDSETRDEKVKQVFSRQHLFMSEVISERMFRAPAMLKETVIANRISGFRNPFFSLLASNLQPFGFYRDFITIFDKDYLSPLTRNSTTRYQFILEDSTVISRDTVYLISFAPARGTRFEGLKGVIGISKSDYAVQQVIAETCDSSAVIAFRFRQFYERQAGGKWFPVQLNTLLQFKQQTVGKDNHLIGVGFAYLSNIRIGDGVSPVQLFDHIALETLPNAGSRDSAYWQANRPFKLSALEQNTYAFMDSALGKTGLETFANVALALSADRIALGKLNLIPSRMLRVNRFEGARLGMGVETSQKVSKIFSLGGYVGWGTEDKALKYGTWLRLYINRKRDMYASLLYRQDLFEAGQAIFGSPWQRQSLSTNAVRNILGINMDSVREMRIDVGLRPVRRNLTTTFSLALQDVRPTYDYSFMRTDNGGNVQTQTNFRFAEATADLLFFAGETNIQLMGHTIFSRHTFPVIKLRLTQGLDRLGGEFNYQKADLSIEQLFRIRAWGRTQIRLDAGITNGQAPLTKLYFMAGGNVVSSPLMYINHAFQTVGLYDFAADRYAALSLEHRFGAIYRGWRYCRPSPTLVHRMAWGAINQPENHTGVTFQIPTQGLFESGLIINHLLRVVYSKTLWLGLGAGVFQRYGLHKSDSPHENRAFRLLIKFDF